MLRAALCLAIATALFVSPELFNASAQQPAEPSNINPINGEVYYLINQLSGMQADLNNGSTTAGAALLQQLRSFTSLTQRWALTNVSGGFWVISNLANGLCIDSGVSAGSTTTVQNPCVPTNPTQQWTISAATNGYVTLQNHDTGLDLDVTGASSSAGATLDQSALASVPTQSQQWLLRPAFFRGVDNALLEKQEEERVSAGIPWWQDAGQPQDVLQILKNRGVNLVRIRPASVPPYNTLTPNGSSGIPATCTGNGCYAETDSVDLDLAKRAKQLGMSIELTLFFDGGSSTAIPGAWSSDTLAQAETDLYNYVKAEVEAYRSAGVMPDMVTIGNEVDTGFLGSLGSPTGSNFTPFAALQRQGMQAILDASSDSSIGLPLPPPIRCIHITPAWDLTNFFGYVNTNNIPYDAMCQSYYPFDHGPLTPAQASASNPDNQPVEQTALTNAANSIGKPVFVIETAEHSESGFGSNDPWYPATLAGQRQFLIDLDSVMKALPNNLGMGLEYWDPAGVNIPKSGGYTNGDGTTDATYTWNGLTLFDNADASGSSQSSAPNYSAVLPAADALGGRLDPTLTYKLVNTSNNQVLAASGTSGSSGTPLTTTPDSGIETPAEQWTITSDGNGLFQIANQNVASGQATEVLDTGGSTTAGSPVVASTASSDSASQEWNILTEGNGDYAVVNKLSGLVLAVSGSSVQQQAPSSTSTDWIVPASSAQQWQLVPVHISSTISVTPPAFSLAASESSLTIAPGGSANLGLTLTPSGGYNGTITMSCSTAMANVSCSFSPGSYTADGSNTTLTGTVTLSSTSSSAQLQSASRPRLLSLVWLLPGGVILSLRRRGLLKHTNRTVAFMLLGLALPAVSALTACGGGNKSGGGGGGSPPVTGAVTVLATGSANSVSQSITLSVTIQ
ncbi:MAG: RICIN domain-containing protein [Acidobacteriaceae bacterium]